MKHQAGFLADHKPSAIEQPSNNDRDNQHPFAQIAEDLGKLVIEKNEAYGSAYALGAAFLELLFPQGVHVYRYTDMLLAIRIFDKLMRIAHRKDAFGESPYKDLAGYGILGAHKDSRWEGKGPEPSSCPDVGERVSG